MMPREQLGCGSSVRLILKIDVGELLAVAIAHDKAGGLFLNRRGGRENKTTLRSYLDLTVQAWIRCRGLPQEGAMPTHEALVKLALFCANQARTSVMKDTAREAWRLTVEYRDQAAHLGEPPDIGKRLRHADEA
jgi:hypothetical protein